jgi:hypothetical protein
MYKVYIFYIKKQSLDASIINNYRPISNLPFISKSIEKVVLQQLHFLALHSTEIALIKLVNDICLLPAARCRVVVLRGGAASRQPAAGSMSQFMYRRESKPKLFSPNSYSTMAEITPTTVSLWKYKRRQYTEKCRSH